MFESYSAFKLIEFYLGRQTKQLKRLNEGSLTSRTNLGTKPMPLN